MPDDSTPTLADAKSPFLQHGARQPVAWLPWGEAAFARARRENRPILLDIGAVWCHWCHVMDHESYEDPETARVINELFVPVKVDRDERPDVDARYQRAVQAISGQGGWPLTAFLTPEGEVFYGGTYFPPEDRFGRPGFRRVLAEVARVWREEPERALEAARSIRARLEAYDRAEAAPGTLSAAIVEEVRDAFAESFDFRHGGFGRAPKFPNAGALDLMLDGYLESGLDWMRRIVTETLSAMGRGGIRDQLGGGFHRYAVDAKWRIPHFEKMAYDNGVLLESYARAYAVFRTPSYRAEGEGIVEYYREIAPALRERGGFPASQDADVGPHDDGAYWTWSAEEVRTALGGEERLVRAATLRYGLDDPESAMHADPDRHVLYRALEPAEVAARLGVEEAEAGRMLEEAARRLKAARDLRPRPYVDETLYAGWVGLVASGHIAAARWLGLPEAGEAALRALDRVWEEGWDAEQGLAHRIGDLEAGVFLEDHAHVARALLDAFEWSQRPAYLERTRQVVEVMERRFRDPESGAYTDRPRDEPAVGMLDEPHRPIVDSPTPSGNAVAALVLLRLAALLHSEEHRDRAHAVLRAFAGSAGQMPTAVATYARAVEWATAPLSTVVVVGSAEDPAADALLETALSTYRPRTVVRRFAPDAVAEGELAPALRAMVSGDSPRAYLCVGQSCAPPVERPEALAELLRTWRT